MNPPRLQKQVLAALTRYSTRCVLVLWLIFSQQDSNINGYPNNDNKSMH